MIGSAGLATHFYRQNERARRRAAGRGGAPRARALRRGPGGAPGRRGAGPRGAAVRPARAPADRRPAQRRARPDGRRAARVLRPGPALVRGRGAGRPTTCGRPSARCRAFWVEREQIVARLDGQPTTDLDRQWRADLLDLGILTAHFHARLVPAGTEGDAHRRALAVLDEAESLLGPSAALCLERAAHAGALGMSDLAEASGRARGAAAPHRLGPSRHRAGAAGRPGRRRGGGRVRAVPGARSGVRLGQPLSRRVPAPPGRRGRRARRRSRRASPWPRGRPGSSTTAPWPKRAPAGSTGRAPTTTGPSPSTTGSPRRCSAAPWFTSGRAARPRRSPTCGPHSRPVPPATVHYHTALVERAGGNPTAAVAALRECLACDPTHPEARAALADLTPGR
ncbi:hypothetical protein FTUN_6355 [Frigoriglobus tundricola]|uniref:Tetratricopeptide repeat protein n=1 Tax=Frigoriglobus tundricola TaxID=2774151 RepID=A0A6M5YZ90_9BACT|nr:hypothetical protein FTUN_6355 [Frigoriglobus tundricola]